MQPRLVICLDFDGTIIDSAAAKLRAFERMFSFLKGQDFILVKDILVNNQGVPREKKFLKIYHEILQEDISKDMLDHLSNQLDTLISMEEGEVVVLGGLDKFLNQHSEEVDFYIASAAPKREIISKLKSLGLINRFKGISGSERPKSDAIAAFVKQSKCKLSQAYMIGDTLNDYVAANEAGVQFIGFGSEVEFVNKSLRIIKEYKELNYLLER